MRRNRMWFTLVPIVMVIISYLYVLYDQIRLANYWREKKTGDPYPLRLVDGWFMGRKMDLTDHQWRVFRQFLPLLAFVALVFCVVSRTLFKLFQNKSESTKHIAYRPCNPIRCIFYVSMSILFVFYLYGPHGIWPIAVSIMNYLIGSSLRNFRFQPLVTWAFNLFILISSKQYESYEHFTFRLLDTFGLRHYYLPGKVSWATYFNITMCRLISYNVDLRETVKKVEQDSTLLNGGIIGADNKYSEENWSEYRKRQEEPRSLHYDYGFLYYFIYIFYLPCYIAGPICSYNAFISFLNAPQKEVSKMQLLRMTFMVVLYVLLLEIGIHYVYPVGFNDNRCWMPRNANYCASIMNMSSADVMTTGLNTLMYMFLKFTIIWRFFRVWALWDGQNVPENMTRCVYNNYLVSDFWRSWHRSMYLWIVKYMYVPLGGRHTRLLSIWIIFGFVAIWHDLWLRWAAWAYFNAFLMAIEAVFQYLLIPAVLRHVNMNFYQKRIGAAVLASINICFLICANLAIMYGFEDTRQFLGTVVLWAPSSFISCICAAFVLFFASLVMMWIRDLEDGSTCSKIN
jgi:D-alanyl-lipoteichoic acid acyltransferase DltB (MBOAT superfamily)